MVDRLSRKHRQYQPYALPPRLYITDAACGDAADILAGMHGDASQRCAVIIRDYAHPHREAYAWRIAQQCRKRNVLCLVAGDPILARKVGADGVHLPGWAQHQLPYIRRAYPRWRVIASTHSVPVGRALLSGGVDALLLSPVFPTRSHPECAPLGTLRFRHIVHQLEGAVYALGGVEERHLRALQYAGAAGIAGISVFYKR